MRATFYSIFPEPTLVIVQCTVLSITFKRLSMHPYLGIKSQSGILIERIGLKIHDFFSFCNRTAVQKIHDDHDKLRRGADAKGRETGHC